MNITKLALKQRTSVIVLTLLLALGGLATYVAIPKESFPSIEIPTIVITAMYPGVSPSDMESLVTKPIEKEVQKVNGIKEIRSTSTEGVSTIVVEFNPEISMDDAFQKVRDKVDVAKAELPEDVEEPMVNEIDLSEFPVMTVNLAADYSLAQLKEVAEDLADELESIPSILDVDVIGGRDREVEVNVDLNKLKAYNLSFNDVINAINQENVNIPGGTVEIYPLNYTVRASGEFETPDEIRDIVIKVPPGAEAPIYVRDVANVRFAYKDPSSYARLRILQLEGENGFRPADPAVAREYFQVVSLNVKKRSGENIIEATDAVKEKLKQFKFPPGTQVVITGDQSKNVKVLVSDLENSIISGLIFVVSVLLFFMGVRNALLVGIAIPLSMFTGFIVFAALGYTLNFVILFSLIIALGMLVDNAIVIVENIYRYREEGHSRWEAAWLGTKEVAGPVVASTATTVAAFAPMLFWPGIIGKFMSYLPITLIITLTSSLFVALFINPVVTGYFVRLEQESGRPMSFYARVLGVILLSLAALTLGLMNPITLGVLVGSGVLIYLLHIYILYPLAQRFMHRTFPAIVEAYRRFLASVLERNYAVRYAYLRNMFSLVSFTLGVVALIIGGGLMLLNRTAAMVFLLPGGLFLVLGLVGIFIHTLETVFTGGKGSVKFGLGLLVTFALVVGGVMLGGRSITPRELAVIFALPLGVILVGGLGVLFGGEKRPLILTDNRAKLMNTALGALFGIVILFGLAPSGAEFFPQTDPNQILIRLEGRPGTSIDGSNALALQAQQRIDSLLAHDAATRANVENILVNVGVGGDARFGGGAPSPERSQLILNLVDYKYRVESSRVTLERIREELKGIPGAEIEITQDRKGPPTGPPVNIEISGEDFDELVRIASEVKQRLIEAVESGRIPGLVDIRDNLNTGKPEFHVHIDRERARYFGLNTATIARTIRTAIHGTEASKYRTGEDEYDIVVRLPDALRKGSFDALKNLSIRHEGKTIPLSAVADFEVTSGLGSITRVDLKRVITIQGSAAPGYSGPEVLRQVQEYLRPYQKSLPPGYVMNYTGENEDQQESYAFLTRALLIGLTLIFLIMVYEFNSVSAPFIIMIAVGLSFIGVILGLLLTRTPFGLMVFIGIISLAGVVVNNNIVLIDYTMQLRERGFSRQEALIKAGSTRLRPVLLTALTTVLGLVPLTFGINIDFVGLLTELKPDFYIGSENTQFWGPMGTTIISGLTFATFLTLVITPVMYSLFDSVSLKLRELLSGRQVPAGVHGDGQTEEAVRVNREVSDA